MPAHVCVVGLLLERKDVFLLLVAVGDVAGAATEVEEWLVVVRGGRVLGVLVEAQFALIQHAVQVHPRSAVMWQRTKTMVSTRASMKPSTHLLDREGQSRRTKPDQLWRSLLFNYSTGSLWLTFEERQESSQEHR